LNKNLKAALEYQKLGYSIFPLQTIKNGRCSCNNWQTCDRQGKHPRTAHGLKDATTDKAQIETWFKSQPDSNIGLCTGAVNGNITIDIDPKDDGFNTLVALEKELGELPETVEQISGSGGRHLMYEHPGFTIKNKVKIAKGIDIRGDGGYIVVSPSIHLSGKTYEWKEGHKLGEAPFAKLPEKWLQFIQGSKKESPVNEKEGLRLDDVLTEGKRNDTIFKLASSLRGKGLLENEIMATVKAVNTSRCFPPLPDAEIKSIVKSVKKYDIGDIQNEPWEMPVPFDSPFILPNFPLYCFPDWVAEFIEAVAEDTQTPEDMGAVIALGVLSIPCNKIYKVQGKPGWEEPTNLFCTVIAKPGERKSAIMAHVTRPVYEYESIMNDFLRDEVSQNQTERKILEKEVEKLREKAAKDGTMESKTKAIEKAVELSRFEDKKELRLSADDVSPEKLAGLLTEQNGRMAIISAEGGIFDIMNGRYSQQNMNLDVFLKGHAGDPLRVDRVGRSNEYIQEPALTLVIAIQPEVLAGIMQNNSFRGRGLTARFLFSMPSSKVGARNIESNPIPEHIKNSYSKFFRSMFDAKIPDKPYLLKLSAGAYKLSVDFAKRLEPRFKNDLEMIADWASKLHGAILRIAGILHAAEHAHQKPREYEISERTFLNSITIGEYFIEHAKAAFALMGADFNIEGCKYVLRWLEKEKRENVKKRDILRSNRGRFKAVAEIEPVLKMLCEYGYLREYEPYKDGAGKKPDKIYFVNPLIYDPNYYGLNGQNGLNDFDELLS
jgi:hypothetical protein